MPQRISVLPWQSKCWSSGPRVPGLIPRFSGWALTKAEVNKPRICAWRVSEPPFAESWDIITSIMTIMNLKHPEKKNFFGWFLIHAIHCNTICGKSAAYFEVIRLIRNHPALVTSWSTRSSSTLPQRLVKDWAARVHPKTYWPHKRLKSGLLRNSYMNWDRRIWSIPEKDLSQDYSVGQRQIPHTTKALHWCLPLLLRHILHQCQSQERVQTIGSGICIGTKLQVPRTDEMWLGTNNNLPVRRQHNFPIEKTNLVGTTFMQGNPQDLFPNPNLRR